MWRHRDTKTTEQLIYARQRETLKSLCASVSLWLENVTTGSIITNNYNQTTEAQRHRDD